MKKFFLVFFLATTVVCSGTFAQKLDIGLKGGINWSYLKVDNLDYNVKTGFHVGAFAAVKFMMVGVQPELIYSTQGAILNDEKINLSYVNVPVMLNIYFLKILKLQLGSQLGYLVAAKNKTLDQDIRDAFKSTDISLGMGLGLNLPLGLRVEGRYNLGLTDIDDSDLFKIRNQVVQLSVGYTFI